MFEKSIKVFYRKPSYEYPIRITPGPFEVSPQVLKACELALAGHRTEVFRNIIVGNNEMLLEAFGIAKKDQYYAVVLSGTGTAAMEAMVASTVPIHMPLVLVNGRFSQRLADMSLLHNPKTKILSFGIGQAVDVNKVELYLKNNPEITQLLFGIQDSRECILNPYQELTTLAKKHGLLLCVDSISALVCEDLKIEKNEIDLFTCSSGKSIGGLPGLGIVCGRRQILDTLDSSVCKSYYLNLHEHYQQQSVFHEPRFAPAMAIYYALHQALTELLEQGVEQRRMEIWQRTEMVREQLRNTELSLLRAEHDMPHSLTSYVLPAGISFNKFQLLLQKQGFLIYSGSSQVIDCIQIGTGGYLTEEILRKALCALRKTLNSLAKE